MSKGRKGRMEKQATGFVKAAEAMYEEVRIWREAHQEASIDEIVTEVTQERRKVMGELVAEVGLRHSRRYTY
jgi:hypothetical protein